MFSSHQLFFNICKLHWASTPKFITQATHTKFKMEIIPLFNLNPLVYKLLRPLLQTQWTKPFMFYIFLKYTFIYFVLSNSLRHFLNMLFHEIILTGKWCYKMCYYSNKHLAWIIKRVGLTLPGAGHWGVLLLYSCVGRGSRPWVLPIQSSDAIFCNFYFKFI